MIRLVRCLLLLGMAILAWQLVTAYAYDFPHGYPIPPLLAFALGYWIHLRLKPAAPHSRRVITGAEHPTFDTFLLILLAITGSALILHQREEPVFSSPWFLHMTLLTLFLLLISHLVGDLVPRSPVLITALTSLLLIGILWRGTDQVAQQTSDLELSPSRRPGQIVSGLLPR